MQWCGSDWVIQNDPNLPPADPIFLSTHSNNPSTCGWTSVSPGNIRPILIDHGLPPVSVCPSVRSITPLFKFLGLPLLSYTVVEMFHVSTLSTFLKPNISINMPCQHCWNIIHAMSILRAPNLPETKRCLHPGEVGPNILERRLLDGQKSDAKSTQHGPTDRNKKKLYNDVQCQKYIQNIDTLVKMRWNLANFSPLPVPFWMHQAHL